MLEGFKQPCGFYCGVRLAGRRRSDQLRFHEAPLLDTKKGQPCWPSALSHHCVLSQLLWLQPPDWFAQEWRGCVCCSICQTEDQIIGFSVLELKIIAVSIPLPNRMILTLCSWAHTGGSTWARWHCVLISDPGEEVKLKFKSKDRCPCLRWHNKEVSFKYNVLNITGSLLGGQKVEAKEQLYIRCAAEGEDVNHLYIPRSRWESPEVARG